MIFCHHQPTSHFLAWLLKVPRAIAVQTHAEVSEVSMCVVTSGSPHRVDQIKSGRVQVEQIKDTTGARFQSSPISTVSGSTRALADFHSTQHCLETKILSWQL